MSEAKLNKKQLAGLRRRFPLPEGVPDAEMNLGEISKFMSVSTTTINNWLLAGVPTLEKGGNGKEYKFRAGDVWSWKKARDSDDLVQSAAAQKAIQAMRLALVGGGIGESIDALSPKDKREVIQTQIAHEQFQRERNELLLREDVREAFEEVYSLIRDALNTLPDHVNRETNLTASQVNKVAELCDSALTEAERSIADFFAQRPVRDKSLASNLFEVN